MEKGLLSVRMKLPAAKRRRKVSAGGGGGGVLAKAIAEYLASDSYMYAPLVSDPQQQPPPPKKEVTLVQKYRGSRRGTFTAW